MTMQFIIFLTEMLVIYVYEINLQAIQHFK